MNELEVKELVERIVSLEIEAEYFRDAGEESAARQDAATELELQLEQDGYMLGEDGADMLVYRCDGLLFVRSTWLLFDRAKWEWRESA